MQRSLDEPQPAEHLRPKLDSSFATGKTLIESSCRHTQRAVRPVLITRAQWLENSAEVEVAAP